MRDVRLYNGDCLSRLRKMPDASVDAVITDPPFSDVTHNGARSRTVGANSRPLVPFKAFTARELVAFATEAVRVARRWVVVFCDWRHAAALEPANLPLVRLGVWIKPNSAPQLSGDRPATGWEAIAIMHRPGRKRWNGGGKRAVWTCSRVNAAHHPTEKPVPLLAELLSLFTDPGETVLDPYMGSGTTGVACAQSGRRFIGIEQSPAYFAIAKRRIAEARATARRELTRAA